MKRFRWLVTLWLAVFLTAARPVQAQQNTPHLAYALPAGGQKGATFQAKVGGQFLANVTYARFSGSGIRVTVSDYARPMNGMQATQLRDRLQELQKLPVSAEVQKEMGDIRLKLLIFNTERLISPVLAETVTLQIAIAADAEPGDRELRLETPQGLSNPLVFRIGTLPEYTEKEAVDFFMQPGGNQPQIRQPATNMTITLPATVNGRIRPGLARPQVPARSGQPFTPGDADRYRFQAHKGQPLVAAASARELMPYLADAVPGWFQATLGLFDAKGKEVAYMDDYRFHSDPVLHYVIPEDGEYAIEIKDAIYRGREDFVYRITLGELPFVTSIFPLGCRAGTKVTIALQGWNLPVAKLAIDARGKEPGIFPVSVSKGELISNHEPFVVDTLPEAFEKEPNNSQKVSQRVTLPVIVNGRIDKPGDWDIFSFRGRAGEEIVAEVNARRLDSPLDSVLKLIDAAGRQLAFNDDHEDKGAGLSTHYADALVTATLPANGTYYLYLGDTQQQGGPEYAYRLRISPPQPDFDLRVVPSSINVPGGMSVPITVYALRKDGFSGAIELALKDAPRGFVLSGGLVPAQQDQVRFTLTAPLQPLREPVSLRLEGYASIRGRDIRRAALPAEDMMQAFAYRHLVPAQDLKVVVPRRGALRAPAAVIDKQLLKIPAGSTVRLQVQLLLPLNNPFEKIQYELSGPPEGIALREVSQIRDGAELVIACDDTKIKPGLKGNLIVNIIGERVPPAANTKAPANTRQRIPLGTLPAIPFEIIQK
jgi:hypothetical protein